MKAQTKVLIYFSLALASNSALANLATKSKIISTCLEQITDCHAIESSLETRDFPIGNPDVMNSIFLLHITSSYSYTLRYTEALDDQNTRAIRVPGSTNILSDWKYSASAARDESLARCEARRLKLIQTYPVCE